MKHKKHKVLLFGNGDSEQLIDELYPSERFEFLHSSNVPDTLTRLIEDNIDLVLLQDRNAEQDAIKLCRIIKTNPRFNYLPVIYLARTFNKEYLIRAYEAGADEYFDPMVNFGELKEKIELELILSERRRQASPKYRYHQQKLRFISHDIESIKQELLNQKHTTMSPDSDLKRMDIERQKSAFLQILVQEMRSPVSAVIGFTDMLREDNSSLENREYIETLTEASGKSRELLDLALLITEVDPEKSTNKMRPYKVSSVVDYALDDHRDLIRVKHLTVFKPSESEITEVVIDPGLIKEVVRIFIHNAILHSPRSGKVNISVSETVDKVELRITDSGMGFSLSLLNTVNKFLNIPGMPGRSEWPGLHFAIAKFIMDIHHGEIKVENNAKGGATVKLIFPVNNAQREALHQLLSQLN